MKRILLVALVLAVPGVAAQANVAAEMEVGVQLDGASFTTASCPEPVNPLATDGEASALEAGFRYTDTEQAVGCLRIRAPIDVPAGASTMAVAFEASKQIAPPTGSVAPQPVIDTAFQLSDQGSPQSFLNGTLLVDEEPVLRTFAVLPGPTALIWHVEEVGGQFLAPLNTVPSPYAVTVVVEDAYVVYRGINVLEDAAIIDHAVGNDAVEQHLRAAAQVPASSGAKDVTFRISNVWSIHHVEVPGGDYLPLTDFDSREEAGTLYLTIPAAAIETFGAGTYTAVFASTRALEPTPLLVPLILALALAPVVAGIFATRGAVRFRERAAAGYEGTARNLLNAILLVWAGYLVTGGFVLFGRMWPLIVTWPIQIPAAMVHGGFVITTVAFIVLNLSWRKQLDESMQEALLAKERANQELKRSNDELEQFAYIASHDLQEPLRTVARFTQLLERRYGDQLDDDAREFMAYSVGGAKRMQDLLDDLLRYSRIDSRGTQFTPVDLAQTMQHVQAALADQIQERGAEITVGALPTVLGDARQLEQVLQNLVSNAMKFCEAQPVVRVEAERTGKVWSIHVRDNGIGIAPEHHDRIFTVFQRLHGREAYAGTGIGLAICKKVVERHGGTIRVRSEGDGLGSTFTFTLAPAD